MTRALALDLGERRIGVAVSDSGGKLATPVTVVQRTRDRPRDHRAIAALVAEYDVDAVVVGLPLSLDGSQGPAARSVLDECAALAEQIRVPIHTHDERFTTTTAERVLSDQQLDGRARRKVVDMVAASIILQDWLDRQAATASPEGS
jgi:putative Holliday junction resolvase